jgi:hypothetical protein
LTPIGSSNGHNERDGIESDFRHPAFDFLSDIFPIMMKYVGLGIALWETLVEKVDRPSILLLSAGMMGLDKVVEASGLKKKRNGNGK